MVPQAVTPELRKWIAEQAQAGFDAESVLQAMRGSGWDEDVAIAAIELTMLEHLKSRQPALPPPIPVPEPMPEGSAHCLDAGDREIQVITSVSEPRLLIFANLLSDAECDAVIEAARTRLTRSRTVALDDGSEQLHEDRTSNGMFFNRGENALVQCIEKRIALLLRWPEQNGEGLQVLQYRPGAEYKPHYDYFEPSEPGTATLVLRGGQRVATPDHLPQRAQAWRRDGVPRGASGGPAMSRPRCLLQL